eukprot:scaffold7694_cov63-Phaeocystis_antarctica.AAC.4
MCIYIYRSSNEERRLSLRTWRVRPIHLACELPPRQARGGHARCLEARGRTPRGRPQLRCCRADDAGVHVRGPCPREHGVKPGGACARSKRRLELLDDRVRAHGEEPAGRERRDHRGGCVVGLQGNLAV